MATQRDSVTPLAGHVGRFPSSAVGSDCRGGSCLCSLVWISVRSLRFKHTPFCLCDPGAGGPLGLFLFLSLSAFSNLRCFVQTSAACFLIRKSNISGRKSGLIHITGNVIFGGFMKNGVFSKESSR